MLQSQMTYNFNRRNKMKTDIYTKVVLTAIAVGLFLNIGIGSIPSAHAELGSYDKLYIEHSGTITCNGCN
jgi:hypothetical protein